MFGRTAVGAGLLFVGSLLGCGDDSSDSSPPPPVDTGMADPDTGTGTDARVVEDSGDPTDATVTPVAECLDTLDMDVVTPDGGDALPGRMVVAWIQLSDDGPMPDPIVAYDMPFAGSSTTVSIPLAGLTPPSDPLLACMRACPDVTTCPCTGEPKVGLGFVAVVTDANGNGAAEPSEVLESSGWVGVGNVLVGHSDTAHMPATAPLDGLFPNGILEGDCPYRIIPNGNEPFDALGYPGAGQRFPLNACSAGGCMFRFPNLT